MSAYFPFRLKVGGTWIPLDGSGSLPAIKYQGATFSIQAVDGTSAGRNQKGTMVRDMVASKVKWQLEFVPCTQSQLYHLLQAVKDEKFLFCYPDPMQSSGVEDGKYFYVGDRTAPVWTISHDDTSDRDVELWGNVKFNLVEI